MLADSHCHLDEFEDAAAQVKKALEKGVVEIVSNSVDLKSMERNLELARRFENVKCALGLHPSNILQMNLEEIERGLEFIEKNIKNCIAVGETGLDFKHAKTTEEKEKQKRIFIRHIEIANKYKKPIVVHSRMARKECVELLEEYSAQKVLMHWFVASDKLLAKVTNLGYFITIGPSVMFSKHMEEFVRKVPLQNLLLETDAPVRYNGKVAEPCWIEKIAETVAECLRIDIKLLECKLEKNFSKLFYA